MRAWFFLCAAAALSGCDPAVPDSGAGVGFGNYDSYQAQLRRDTALATAQRQPAQAPASSAAAYPSAEAPAAATGAPTAAEIDAALGRTPAASDVITPAAPAPAPVRTGALPSGGNNGSISDEQSFEAVADIGCGTAVLAMAAAKTGSTKVYASDIDEVAVDVAMSNLKANDLADAVTCLEAAGFDHPDFAGAVPFDLIFANILKGPLIALAPDIAGALRPGGVAILSGILNPQADDVVEVYTRCGFNLTRRAEIVDWTTLTLAKIA